MVQNLSTDQDKTKIIAKRMIYLIEAFFVRFWGGRLKGEGRLTVMKGDWCLQLNEYGPVVFTYLQWLCLFRDFLKYYFPQFSNRYLFYFQNLAITTLFNVAKLQFPLFCLTELHEIQFMCSRVIKSRHQNKFIA